MSELEKHHYLPVFYLARWSRPDGKVMRYYRPHKDVVASPISPKHTGFERGLYQLDGYSPEKKNLIEKEFMAATVDDPAAQAMTILIARDNSKLTPERRYNWTRFVLSLVVRNPEKLQEISRDAAKGLSKTLSVEPEQYASLRSEGDPPTLSEGVEQYAPAVISNYGKQILPGIITHRNSNNEIAQMRWWTVSITNGFPDLLTGDRPVFMSHGLMDERCVIALPMSPKFVFFATRSQVTFERLMSRGVKAVIKSINESIVCQAESSVYGAHDGHLRFVENRLKYRLQA